MTKQKPIKKQHPWLITSYSSIQNKDSEDEFDAGYIEFEHRQTSVSFRKEMSWLKGEGPYKVPGFRTPKLLDVWNTFVKYTPGTTGFVYKEWHIKRDNDCFIYILVDLSTAVPRYKNIIGDFVSQQQDFASFIEMLDNIQKEREESTKTAVFDIGEARKKRNAI